MLFLAFVGFAGFLWLGGQLLLTGERQYGFLALGSLAIFLLARAGAFADGVIDAGDIVKFASVSFTFTP